MPLTQGYVSCLLPTEYCDASSTLLHLVIYLRLNLTYIRFHAFRYARESERKWLAAAEVRTHIFRLNFVTVCCIHIRERRVYTPDGYPGRSSWGYWKARRREDRAKGNRVGRYHVERDVHAFRISGN